MPRFVKLAAATAALALALPLATAQAAPAAAVHIEAQTSFLYEGVSGGPFTATGPAVDAGLICATGQTIDVFAKPAGYQSHGGWLNLIIVKAFTCDDGSGAFLVKLEVRLGAHGDHYGWVIMDGEGDYASLRGAGTGYGASPLGDYDVLDVYDGVVTNPG
jgi:hypothetical protein